MKSANNMIKRLEKLCSMFALIVIGALLCENVSQAKEVTISGIVYNLNEEDSTCGVSGFDKLQMSSKVSIPESITQDGKIYKVNYIGDYAFFECDKLEGINLSKNIETINFAAFKKCINLQSISLQEGLKEIKEQSFYGCSSLETICIPATVNAICGNIFQFCDSLTEINVNKGNARYYDIDGVLFWNSSTSTLDGRDYIERRILHSYPGGKLGDTYTIEEDVLMYGDFPFVNNRNLKSIVVDPNNKWYSSVDGVVYDKTKTDLLVCPAGKTDKVDIPEGVEAIAMWAFNGSLASEIIIPDSVSVAGMGAFEECTNIEKLSIGKGFTYNEDNEELFAIDLPACKKLATITVSPENQTLTVIDGVLYNKNKSRIIKCPKSVTKLDVSSNVTSMHKSAFINASNLETITVSKNNSTFTVIDGILYNKDKTSLIMCPKSVTKATIPASIDYVYEHAFEFCSESFVLTVDEKSYIQEYAKNNGLKYVIREKEQFNVGKYKVIKSSGETGEVAFVKPNSSKSTSITIPDKITIDGHTYKVTEISTKAFKNNTKLKSVTIGKNVKKIGQEAFSGCKNLKKITIKSTVLKSVGKNAIKNIDKKATIEVPKKQLSKYKKLFTSKTGYKKTMKVQK